MLGSFLWIEWRCCLHIFSEAGSLRAHTFLLRCPDSSCEHALISAIARSRSVGRIARCRHCEDRSLASSLAVCLDDMDVPFNSWVKVQVLAEDRNVQF